MSKYQVERPGHLGSIERIDEQTRVSDLPSATLASMLHGVDDLEAARGLYESLVDRARALGDEPSASGFLAQLSKIECELGAYELAARHEAMEAGLRRLEELARERGLSDEVAGVLRARHDARRQQYPKSMEDGVELAALGADLRLELIAVEREYLYGLLRDGKITDESRRRLERELDLEEASIFCRKDYDPPL